jgi:3-oxoacyl-[acyl-carrier-protein] synthase-3
MSENIGIRGIGTYFPSQVEDAEFISQKTGIPKDVIEKKFGVKKKPIAGPNDTTSNMGLKAAIKALENAGVKPEELDLVIWNGAQHKDFPCWLASLDIAHRLGAENAWGFDMEAMCGSMMAGFETAKSLMLNNPEVKRVLLCSGYRNNDLISYDELSTSFMYDLGASGSAVVLEKGYDRNVILSSSFKGDGSFSRGCFVPVGGTEKWPMKAEDVSQYHFQIPGDPKAFKKKLGETTLPNFFWVIRNSLEKSGYTQSDIDYLAILHFKRSAHDMIIEELNLTEDKTTYLDDYGHTGQNDQIISLELGLEQGKVKEGSIVVLVGAGLGFVWASSVVKWGPYSDGE